MVSNDLTPEKRVNKHGVPVTKHVRQQPQRRTKPEIPAPSPAVSDSERLIIRLEELLDDWGSKQENLDTLRALNRVNPAVFKEVISALLTVSREERAVWRNALHDGIEKDETQLRRLLEIIPLSVPLFPNAPPGFRYHRITQRAEEAEQMYPCVPGYENYKRVKAGMILDEIRQQYVNPGDRDEFTTFIAENMDAVTPLIPELMKRGDASAGLIRSLMENDTPALNEGVL